MEKKKKILTIVGIVLLLLIVIGASYAYFIAQIGSGASTNITVEADTVDSLTFISGDPINFSLTQDNLAQGGTNVSGSTTATAKLIAGKNRTATYNYNVYLNIAANNFIYTKDETTPELILKVTRKDSSGTAAITSIPGLTYNSTLGGFDITKTTGQIVIASNYEITTTSQEIQNWNIEAIFRNLDNNQTENTGKLFKAEVLIQKEENNFNPTFANICNEGDILSRCLMAYADTFGYEKTSIVKHDGTYENDAGDNNYRYSGGDVSNIIDTTIFGKVSNTYSTYYYYLDDFEYDYMKQISDLDLRDIEVGDLTEEETNILYDFYAKVEDGTYAVFNFVDSAMTDAYNKNLIDSPIKNYVCFGSDAETCPIDNLYRIIGIFDNQIKLIKYDYANSDMLGTDGDYATIVLSSFNFYRGYHQTVNTYFYNYKAANEASNNWETSLLNKTNLNTNYINYLNSQDSKWVNMIANTNWNIGGYSSSSVTARTLNNAEITKQTTKTSKIGLMQMSDYGFATIPSSYNVISFNKNNNWLYMGVQEKTITPMGPGEVNTFYIQHTGYTFGESGNNVSAIRPVFYLKANVTYLSGNGTKIDPLRIN